MPARIGRDEWPPSARRCVGKVRYLTEADAQAGKRRMLRNWRSFEDPASLLRLACYPCDRCGCWHLGRSRRRTQARPEDAEERS